MWRNLTRGFYNQGLKRSLCLEKPDAHLNDGKRSEKRCSIKAVIPCPFEKLNLFKYKDNNQNHGKQKEGPGNIGQHSFFEAFGWSGALVFGWAISKQIWLQNGWFRDQDSRNTKGSHTGFIPFLSHLGEVKTQPPVSFVLPQFSSSKKKDPSEISDLEDEFDKAAKELEAVHEKAIGEALNRRGISCLSKATGADAMKFFRRASELNYPPASFNMGQCYELGIGTEQDFKQAAEWYKIASDQGHPTATYNLGVFYAHGWGGLSANTDTARQLFRKAAQLGQADAKAALENEYKNSSVFNTPNGSKTEYIKIQETKSSNYNYFADNIRHGRGDSIIQKGYENQWDIPITSTLPVAV